MSALLVILVRASAAVKDCVQSSRGTVLTQEGLTICFRNAPGSTNDLSASSGPAGISVSAFINPHP